MRIRWLLLTFVLLWCGTPSSAQAPSRADYAKDVDFLLAELEKQAGGLLAQKGVDWKKVSAQFRTEVKAIASDADHLTLCERLVARLRDGHAGLVDVKVPWPAAEARVTGPRVHLLVVKEQVFVRAAFGAAERAGVRVGMEVTTIDHQPARRWLDLAVTRLRDTDGFSTDHQALHAACHRGLAGPLGTSMELELKDAGDTKKVRLMRDGGNNFAPIGPVVPPPGLKTLGRQSYGKTAAGNGYLHLRDVPGDLPAQLDEMLGAIGPVPGMILDLRANGGGGTDHEAVFARFLPAGRKWRQYTGAGRAPYGGPLVVIIDSGVVSAGETVGGMFKEDGRAYVIGDGPTAGMSSQKTTVTAPSRLFSVRFSVASNKGRFNGGKGIEGIGVMPTEVVPYVPAELRRGVDTQIRRAEELLARGFPPGTVAYPGK